MKDQIFPQIPEENVPQAQSMYEQLRKTSQKWFTTGSHRRIFTNSVLSPSRLSPREPLFSEAAAQSKLGAWGEGEGAEGEEKARLVALMREQIEIACSEYAARFKGALQEQARKIKLLGDLLVKNQIELGRKNRIIEGLVQIIDNREDSMRSGFEQVNAKVEENETKMGELLKSIERLQQKQSVPAKLKALEKQYRDKLCKISSSYASKVAELSEEFEERMDKVEKVIALSQSEPKTNRRAGRESSLTVRLSQLQNLTGELEDLRQEVESFKRKKYRYENYKFEELRAQIAKIHEKLQRHEQACKLRASLSPNLKSSQATHATESNIHIETNPSQTSKSRFLNKYKSLISPRPAAPPHPARRKQSCSSQSESESESEVEETLVGEKGNIQRLSSIIREMSIRTPVRIEIDQTGYAKSVDTGMYLVDALGNGFEFTPEEIAHLTEGGVIAL